MLIFEFFSHFISFLLILFDMVENFHLPGDDDMALLAYQLNICLVLPIHWHIDFGELKLTVLLLISCDIMRF